MDNQITGTCGNKALRDKYVYSENQQVDAGPEFKFLQWSEVRSRFGNLLYEIGEENPACVTVIEVRDEPEHGVDQNLTGNRCEHKTQAHAIERPRSDDLTVPVDPGSVVEGPP